MIIRFRAASAASLTLVLGLSIAAAGCGKYSLSTLKAIKEFKDGNDLYQQKDYKRAADKYEQVVHSPVVENKSAFAAYPQLPAVYFFLANCYDQLYKPAKAGDPQNDAYIQKAIENYRLAADNNADPTWKKRSLQYLAGAYGPDKLNDPAKAEPVYKEIVALDPSEPTNYLQLAKLYEDAGRYDEAEAQYNKALQVKGNDPTVLASLAAYYNRQGQFDKTIDALTKAANLAPNNPEGWHLIATFYWDEANKDFRLTPAQKMDYITKGITMEDKALQLNPDYIEALTYKNILLRLEANNIKDPQKQKQLIDQADQLRNKAMDMQKKKQTGKGE
jgi:tetratricopeptide (TPR) repeat protein